MCLTFRLVLGVVRLSAVVKSGSTLSPVRNNEYVTYAEA